MASGRVPGDPLEVPPGQEHAQDGRGALPNLSITTRRRSAPTLENVTTSSPGSARASAQGTPGRGIFSTVRNSFRSAPTTPTTPFTPAIPEYSTSDETHANDSPGDSNRNAITQGSDDGIVPEPEQPAEDAILEPEQAEDVDPASEQPERPSSRMDFAADDEGNPTTPDRPASPVNGAGGARTSRSLVNPVLSPISERTERSGNSSRSRERESLVRAIGWGGGLHPQAHPVRREGTTEDEEPIYNVLRRVDNQRNYIFDTLFRRIRTQNLCEDEQQLGEVEARARGQMSRAGTMWNLGAVEIVGRSHIEELREMLDNPSDGTEPLSIEVRNQMNEQLITLSAIMNEAAIRWAAGLLDHETTRVTDVSDRIAGLIPDSPVRAASSGDGSRASAGPERIDLDRAGLGRMTRQQLLVEIERRDDQHRADIDHFETQLMDMEKQRDDVSADLARLADSVDGLRQIAWNNGREGRDIDHVPDRSDTATDRPVTSEPQRRHSDYINELEASLQHCETAVERLRRDLEFTTRERDDLNTNLNNARQDQSTFEPRRVAAHQNGLRGLNIEGTGPHEPPMGEIPSVPSSVASSFAISDVGQPLTNCDAEVAAVRAELEAVRSNCELERRAAYQRGWDRLNFDGSPIETEKYGSISSATSARRIRKEAVNQVGTATEPPRDLLQNILALLNDDDIAVSDLIDHLATQQHLQEQSVPGEPAQTERALSVSAPNEPARSELALSVLTRERNACQQARGLLEAQIAAANKARADVQQRLDALQQQYADVQAASATALQVERDRAARSRDIWNGQSGDLRQERDAITQRNADIATAWATLQQQLDNLHGQLAADAATLTALRTDLADSHAYAADLEAARDQTSRAMRDANDAANGRVAIQQGERITLQQPRDQILNRRGELNDVPGEAAGDFTDTAELARSETPAHDLQPDDILDAQAARAAHTFLYRVADVPVAAGAGIDLYMNTAEPPRSPSAFSTHSNPHNPFARPGGPPRSGSHNGTQHIDDPGHPLPAQGELLNVAARFVDRLINRGGNPDDLATAAADFVLQGEMREPCDLNNIDGDGGDGLNNGDQSQVGAPNDDRPDVTSSGDTGPPTRRPSTYSAQSALSSHGRCGTGRQGRPGVVGPLFFDPAWTRLHANGPCDQCEPVVRLPSALFADGVDPGPCTCGPACATGGVAGVPRSSQGSGRRVSFARSTNADGNGGGGAATGSPRGILRTSVPRDHTGASTPRSPSPTRAPSAASATSRQGSSSRSRSRQLSDDLVLRIIPVQRTDCCDHYTEADGCRCFRPCGGHWCCEDWDPRHGCQSNGLRHVDMPERCCACAPNPAGAATQCGCGMTCREHAVCEHYRVNRPLELSCYRCYDCNPDATHCIHPNKRITCDAHPCCEHHQLEGDRAFCACGRRCAKHVCCEHYSQATKSCACSGECVAHLSRTERLQLPAGPALPSPSASRSTRSFQRFAALDDAFRPHPGLAQVLRDLEHQRVLARRPGSAREALGGSNSLPSLPDTTAVRLTQRFLSDSLLNPPPGLRFGSASSSKRSVLQHGRAGGTTAGHAGCGCNCRCRGDYHMLTGAGGRFAFYTCGRLRDGGAAGPAVSTRCSQSGSSQGISHGVGSQHPTSAPSAVSRQGCQGGDDRHSDDGGGVPSQLHVGGLGTGDDRSPTDGPPDDGGDDEDDGAQGQFIRPRPHGPLDHPLWQVWHYIYDVLRWLLWGQYYNVRDMSHFIRDTARYLFGLDGNAPLLPRDSLSSLLMWLLLWWQFTMMIALSEERRLWLSANPRTAAYVRGMSLRRAYPWWSPFEVDYALLAPGTGHWISSIWHWVYLAPEWPHLSWLWQTPLDVRHWPASSGSAFRNTCVGICNAVLEWLVGAYGVCECWGEWFVEEFESWLMTCWNWVPFWIQVPLHFGWLCYSTVVQWAWIIVRFVTTLPGLFLTLVGGALWSLLAFIAFARRRIANAFAGAPLAEPPLVML